MPGTFSPRKLMLARRESGMTQEELAQKIGKSRNTVVLWESGKFTPEERNVAALAEALNRPVPYFFTEELREMREPAAAYGPAKTAAPGNTLTLPLLAGAPDSLPDFLDRDIEGFAQVPRYLFPGADFIVRCGGVRGEEFCVIRKTSGIVPGNKILARTNEGLLVANAVREGGTTELRPEEGGGKALSPDAFKVIGQVVGIWKRLA